MATLIKTTDEEIEVHPADGRYFSLEELQGYVGGMIQIVPLRAMGKELVCNEEGLMLGLPYNDRATTLAYQNGVFVDPLSGMVGDVLIVSAEELE